MIVEPENGRPGGLVAIWSRTHDILGRHYPFGAGITIGRKSDNAIVLDHDGVSRHHARIERRDDAWWIVDAGSMNGTMLNDAKVTEARLAFGDHVTIGGGVIFKVVGDTWPRDGGPYHPDPKTDALTGARNKRHLMWLLDRELKDPKRASRVVSLAMFDLDHFKRLNDAHGHLAGDQVLRDVASILRVTEDIVARYAGEELVWLLVGRDLDAAAKRAETARALIESHVTTFDHRAIKTTISGGVARIDDAMRTPEECIRRVDEKVYEAKCAGRNCVRW